MHGWAPDVIGKVGGRTPNGAGYIDVFFGQEDASRQLGQEAYGRMQARTDDRDAATTWATRLAQYDAVTRWGIPNHAALERVSAIAVPTLIGNGDSDPMILPHFSFLLAGLIP
ncbi:hypothetical protein AB4Z22_46350, partial [Paenibacillus sp. TAF58]